jgi:outer membrane protein assembly factor BamA
MIRIWNIGNFAKVGYELDTLPYNKSLLTIMAQDALTVVPILSFSGNRKDWSLSIGATDNNFLGRNIRLQIGGTLGTNLKDFRLGVNIPRQLLYKNMSVSGGITYGYGTNYKFENRKKASVVAYSMEQISGGISNPWDEDFKYRFSPNFGWSLFRHKTDTSLVDGEIDFPDQYTVKYLALSVGESIGYIQRKRHQRNGFQMSLGLGTGLGLDNESPFYYTIGYGINYYKLFNPWLQLSIEYNTGYTSSNIPSLHFYKGANAVKGILTGEIAGKAYYDAYVGWHLTYINRDWFALEQSFYLNWGNGNDVYMDLYKTDPLYGLGTGFYVNIPMIPWLGMRVYFTYTGKNSNWFRLEL